MMSMPSNRLRISTSLLIGAALLAGCGHEEKRGELPVLRGVATERVAASRLAEVHPAVATVQSRTTSVVSARMMGDVVAIHVGEGDRVRQGEALLEIDSREVSAGLRKASAGIEETDRAIAAADAASAAAEANRKLATSTWERFKILRERRSVSPQEFEEVEARYRGAEAEADRAAETLGALRAKRGQAVADASTAATHASYARIIAPIGGIVASKSVDVGSQAVPGMPLMVIEDDGHFEAVATVEESLSGGIRPGDAVAVRIEAIGATLAGRVSRVVPALDPSTRTSIVKIDLPGDARLRSGLFAEVEFPRGERRGVTVPAGSIVRRGQLEGVFVADEKGVVRLRLVRTGRELGMRVEILSGLDAGERILSDASRGLDGARLEGRP
jgi:RND family efflux transporter MFP subunit